MAHITTSNSLIHEIPRWCLPKSSLTCYNMWVSASRICNWMHSSSWG